MLGGGREDVQNAAANREFAAPADHVHPRVGQLHQPGDHVFERHLVTDGQRQRFFVAQSWRHGLQQGTHRGDHHTQRRTQPGVVRVGEPAQHHQAGADGVDAGREPLVRQRLPGRESRHGVAEDAAQLSGQVVGLTAGGGDHQQRTLLRQRAGDEQARAGGSHQRQVLGPIGGTLDELLEGWRSQRQFDEPAIGVSGHAVPGAVMMPPF